MNLRQALRKIFSFTPDTCIEDIYNIIGLDSKACNIFLIQKAIELGREDIFRECVKVLDNVDSLCLEMCAKYNRLSMLKRLLNFEIRDCPFGVSDYLVSLYNSHPTFQCIKDIQECCRRISNSNVYTFHYNFIKTQTKLRESHIKYIKKELYYSIIQNVICNPNHKIGRKLILKEYYEYVNQSQFL